MDKGKGREGGSKKVGWPGITVVVSWRWWIKKTTNLCPQFNNLCFQNNNSFSRFRITYHLHAFSLVSRKPFTLLLWIAFYLIWFNLTLDWDIWLYFRFLLIHITCYLWEPINAGLFHRKHYDDTVDLTQIIKSHKCLFGYRLLTFGICIKFHNHLKTL